MIRYLQVMMRDEPGTFVVTLAMIGLLAFGAWNALPAPKKASDLRTFDMVADAGFRSPVT